VRILLAAVVGLLLAGVGGGAPSNAASPAANGTIAFVRGKNLWLVRPDGADPRRLTHPASDVCDLDPSWSPDGRKVVFRRGCFSDDLYVIRADGRGLEKLPLHAQSLGQDQFLVAPRWSPDGRRLAFDALVASDGCQIYVGSLKERYARPLGRDHSNSNVCDYFPDWSPDGRWIAFARRNNSGPTRLYLIHPAGSVLRRLTAHVGTRPRWSPDGKRIAFFDANGIFVLNADGTGLRKVTAGWDPAWSPDGSQIVFLRPESPRRSAPTDIWVMNVNGSEPRKIFKGGESPDWQALHR
jgi:Tol biopolymer transport system component